MRAGVDAVESYLAAFAALEVDDKEIPTLAYALIGRDGQIAGGRVGAASAADTGSHFRVGSVTKMFTALALMQLVERREADLDVPITRYLPEFEPPNPFAQDSPEGAITLRKLLGHRAGIAREASRGHYFDSRPASLSETVSELAKWPLKADPAAGMSRYSNAGITVVGAVIERISGLAYEDYVRRHILSPLEMSETEFRLSQRVRQVLAPGWMWDIDGDRPAPVFDLGCAPAGCLISTVDDMSRFTAMLLRGGETSQGAPIVSLASLRTLWSAPPEADTAYGLGFARGALDDWASVGHGGAIYGYSSAVTLLPQAGLAMLVFATLDFAGQSIAAVANAGLRAGLTLNSAGTVPALPHRKAPSPGAEQAPTPGWYNNAESRESIEVRATRSGLHLIEHGVPLRICCKADGQLAIDGRLSGEATSAHAPSLRLLDDTAIVWRDRRWIRSLQPIDALAPDELRAHLGSYGPDYNVAAVTYEGGELRCRIESFFSHRCEPLGGLRFSMHGQLYEDESLELGVVSEDGRFGLNVGPMFLERRY